MHRSYYSSPLSNDTKILFAIARIENARDYFIAVVVLWLSNAQNDVNFVPHVRVMLLPTTKNGQGAVIGPPKNADLTVGLFSKWLVKNFPIKVTSSIVDHQQIPVPIPSSQINSTLLIVAICVFVFSLMFLPGRGLFHYLNWKGSYLRICMVPLFPHFYLRSSSFYVCPAFPTSSSVNPKSTKKSMNRICLICRELTGRAECSTDSSRRKTWICTCWRDSLSRSSSSCSTSRRMD